jgi:A/G-specific adenine glycosylase
MAAETAGFSLHLFALFAALRENSLLKTDAPEQDAAWLRSFRRRVFAWYDKHGRDLSFRHTRDPYRIWISETMLQQTTVAAVVPYYERFLKAFPTVQALAAASEHDVLRLWEGLGYYSRARNLHAAARQIVEAQGGVFPRSASELASLKGIGRYTAGAIASFAFDERAPIVEANTLRLYCRLLAYGGDPRSAAGQQRMWQFAEQIVPRKHAGRFNHALMDLGATVCTPRDPKCDVCPVRANCAAFAQGAQNEVPAPKARPTLTDVTEAYVVVRRNGKILVRQREAGERWAGMWDFPRYELSPEIAATSMLTAPSDWRQKRLALDDENASSAAAEYLQSQLKQQTSIRAEIGDPFAEIRHGVTRFRIRVLCFDAHHVCGSAGSASLRWCSPADLELLALSRSGRRLADLLVAKAS